MKRSAPYDRKSKKTKTKGRGFKSSKIPRAPAMRMASPGEVKALSLNFATGGAITSTFQFDTTGTFQLLNGIQGGAGFSQRVGRKIKLKSLKLQLNINPVANRTAPGDLGRVIIFYDRQTNGALPAVADLLQDTNTAAANTTNIQVGPNLSNRDRFTIIRDYKFTLPAAVVAANGVPTSAYPDSFEGEHQSFIQWYIKLKDMDTVFNAETADIGSIASGSLVIFVAGGVALGTNAWQINSWHSRLRYYDN